MQADPCVEKPIIANGSVEFGRGDVTFAPIADGDSLTFHDAIQHLRMLVVSARTKGLDLGVGEHQGVVRFNAFDQNGDVISLQVGCRALDFTLVNDGYTELAEPFGLVFSPTVAAQIDGTTIDIDVDIRDHAGRRAVAMHSVVAHLPAL